MTRYVYHLVTISASYSGYVSLVIATFHVDAPRSVNKFFRKKVFERAGEFMEGVYNQIISRIASG